MSRKERKDRFSLDVQVGSSGYFVRESSSGFVAGPRETSGGVPRHITVPIDTETGEVRNIHMKSGLGSAPQENWRIVPSEVLPKIASWISRKSTLLAESEVQQIDRSSYSFSVRRGLVTFQVWQMLLDRFAVTLARGLGLFRFDVKETEKQTMVRAIIDPSVVVRLVRRFRPFLGLYTAIVRATFLPALKRVAKLHMVKLSDMADGDVSLVFSKTGAKPLVVVKHSGHKAIPMAVVIKEVAAWYSKFAIREMTPRFSFDTVTPLLMQLSFRGLPEK